MDTSPCFASSPSSLRSLPRRRRLPCTTGQKQYEVKPQPLSWSCSYLSPTLRVSRVEGGGVWVYAKAESEQCQDEIARFLSDPPAKVEGAKKEEGEKAQ